jgi:hypothetical protein
MHEAKDIDDPKDNDDNNDGIQNALDGSLHGNVAIYEP